MAGYASDNEFTAWLADNGYEMPEGAPAIAVLRNRGSAYVDGLYGSRFSGQPTNGLAQERAWPRTGAYAFGSSLASDLIPLRVIHASFEAALQEAREPESLSLIGSAAERVKRERVEGAVEVEYQQSSGTSGLAADITPVMTAIEGLLAHLLVKPMPGILVV